ncbi:MAG: beta-lactamase family protein [Treponemataceae bacterium]|nr:beta-lactamase family protein [Treponemataceae bacterium]
MKIRAKIISIIIILLLFIIVFSLHLDIWGTSSSIEESIAHIIETHRIPYCSIAISRKGETEYISDTLSGEELTPTALFLSNTITEIMTGLSLYLLIDEKKLSLDDKITDFYPWLTFNFEGKPTEITVRQLASHSSGIPLFAQDSLYGEDYEGMLRASMRSISGLNLRFLPGSDYRKTMSDYAILAFIIEKVTGMAWCDYVTDNIIFPLGLENTCIKSEDIPQDSKLISGSRTLAGIIMNYNLPMNSANLTVRGVRTCTKDIISLMSFLSGQTTASEKLMKAGEQLLIKENCAFSPEKTGKDAFFGGLAFAQDDKLFYSHDEMEEFSTSIWCNTEKKESIAVQCSGMRAPSAKILENCRKKLEEKDDFLLSFISTETFDIIYSFLILILLYILFLNIAAIKQKKKKNYSPARVFLSIVSVIIYMIGFVLFPLYFDISYKILYYKSVLAIIIFIALSQVLGFIAIYRIITHKKAKERQNISRFW